MFAPYAKFHRRRALGSAVVGSAVFGSAVFGSAVVGSAVVGSHNNIRQLQYQYMYM